MNLNQLRYFVEAATQLNFSRAAENLYISQPALSRQIHALEETLGVPLFERGNRGLTLTAAGQLLLSEADDVFRREQELLRKLRATGKVSTAPITLAVVNDVFLERAKEFIRDYNRNYGYQKFYLEHLNWNTLRHKLTQGSVDLAFCFSKELDGLKNMVCQPLGMAPNTIAMSRRHPLAGREEISLLDLQGEQIIMPNTVISSVIQELDDACRRLGFTPQITSEYPLRDTVFLEVAMGNGVTLVMQGLLPSEYAPDIVCVPCKEIKSAMFMAAWNRDLETPALQAVVERMYQFPWFGD